MKKFIILSIFTIFLNIEAYANGFTIVTENFPPFNYVENQESKGLAVDMLKAVLREMQLDIPIEFYPWARAYRMSQKNPNVLIFSLARTPERENLFKWAGEIVSYESSLYKINSRKDIQIKSLDEAKKYTIGAVNKTAPADYLISNGFNVELVPHYAQNLAKITYGRIDLIPYNRFSLIYEARNAGYDPDNFQSVAIINKYCLYFAFSKDTSDDLVLKFSDTLNKIKNSGLYDEIVKQYVTFNGQLK